MTATALALLLSAFPDSSADRWTVERTWETCRLEEPCELWVEALYPMYDPGPDDPTVRYKCAAVLGYVATCYEWGPNDTGWVLLWD